MALTPIWIFRITHVDNLQGILQRRGVYAPNFNPKDELTYKYIHHLNIQTQRADKAVPCGPGGVLHDYVPFYFAPRSPMLYVIHKGNVQDYQEGQDPVIYLVSDAQSVLAADTGFVFTDGHAIMEMSDFYDDLSQLSKVDWHAMRLKYWYDSPQTPDRKRRRQAEFLVYRYCPWPLVRVVGVISSQMKRRVEAVLADFPRLHRPIVQIKPEWYY